MFRSLRYERSFIQNKYQSSSWNSNKTNKCNQIYRLRNRIRNRPEPCWVSNLSICFLEWNIINEIGTTHLIPHSITRSTNPYSIHLAAYALNMTRNRLGLRLAPARWTSSSHSRANLSPSGPGNKKSCFQFIIYTLKIYASNIDPPTF